MALTCFDVNISERIAHVVLNRPDQYNSMIAEFWAELPSLIEDLDRGSKARVIVVSSTGKHFTSGMDLGVFTGAGAGLLGGDGVQEEGRKRSVLWLAVQHLQESFTALERCRIPVLAAVQGGCIGGGIDMICAADARYATADAFFCVQEINIGMAADLGVLQRLPKIIAPGVAREMAYTGERLGAERALAIGLVNAVLPDAEALVAHTLSVARTIAAKSPLAIAGTKLAMNYARDHGTAAALAQMATLQSAIFDTGEMAEAITAWRDKREGRFTPLDPVGAH